MRCMCVLSHVPRVSKLWHVKPIPMTFEFWMKPKLCMNKFLEGTLSFDKGFFFYTIPGYSRLHTGKTMQRNYKRKIGVFYFIFLFFSFEFSGSFGTDHVLGTPNEVGPSWGLAYPACSCPWPQVASEVSVIRWAPAPFTWDEHRLGHLTNEHHGFLSVTVTVCHRTCICIYLIGLRLLMSSYS